MVSQPPRQLPFHRRVLDLPTVRGGGRCGSPGLSAAQVAGRPRRDAGDGFQKWRRQSSGSLSHHEFSSGLLNRWCGGQGGEVLVTCATGVASAGSILGMVDRTDAKGRPTPAASRGPVLGTAAAYAAGVVAFAYALVSLYWALGGRGLISTVGGYVEQFARRGGAAPVLVAWAVTVAKATGVCSRSRWSGLGGGWFRGYGC
jgi:hypothetical protein